MATSKKKKSSTGGGIRIFAADGVWFTVDKVEGTGDDTVTVTAEPNESENDRSGQIGFTTEHGVRATVDVYQEGDYIVNTEYSTPVVTEYFYDSTIIPASGGEVTPTVEWTQLATYTWASGKVTTETLINPGTLSFILYGHSSNYIKIDLTTGVCSGTDLGTTLTSGEKIEVVAVITANGIRLESDYITINREDNQIESITYAALTIDLTYVKVARVRTLAVETIEVPAAGGEYSPVLAVTQVETDTYTSGATAQTTLDGDASGDYTVVYTGTSGLVDASTGVVTVASLGTTIKEATTVESVTATVTMNGQSADSTTFNFVQAENKVESTAYDTPVVSVDYEGSPVPAAGGTLEPTIVVQQVQTDTYSSGATDSYTITPDYTISASDSQGWVDGSTGVVTVPALSAGETSRTDTVTVTVTANSATSDSVTATITQSADEIVNTEYDVPEIITIVPSESVVAAAGGTVSFTVTYTQTVTYTWASGNVTTDTVTTGGTLAFTDTAGLLNSNNEAVIPGLGTTVTAAADVDTVSVTVTINEKTSAAASVTLSQEANEQTLVSTDYGIPVVTLSYDKTTLDAAGETATPTVTFTQSVVYNYTYTSGATSSTSDTLNQDTAGTATYTYSGTNGVVDPSSGTVTAGPNAKEEVLTIDVVTVSVVVNGQTGTSDSVTIYQESDYIINTTYTTPTVTMTYPDIDAGGGSVTPTVTYSQVVTYTWEDGSTTTETLTSGATLSYTGTGVNTGSGSVSADSLGTTVKDRTLITTATVTVTLNGQTGTATADVYQALNQVESTATAYTYDYPNIEATYDDISAAGGTVTPTVVYSQLETITYTDTYSSGSTGTRTETNTLTSEGTISYSGDGVSTVNGEVTAASLGTTLSDRSAVAVATVTVTANGKSNNVSVTVYQEANTRTPQEIVIYYEDDGIWYMPSTSGTRSVDSTLDEIRVTYLYTSGSTLAQIYENVDQWTAAGGTISLSVVTACDGFALNGNVGITYTENDGTSERGPFVIKVTATLDGVSGDCNFTYYQNGATAYLTVSPTSLTFDAAGGSSTISVSCNETWAIEVTND